MSPFPPTNPDEVAKRIIELETHVTALWALIADWYAFRDEKNFASFIESYRVRAGSMIEDRAAERLQRMIARGPTSRGDPEAGGA